MLLLSFRFSIRFLCAFVGAEEHQIEMIGKASAHTHACMQRQSTNSRTHQQEKDESESNKISTSASPATEYRIASLCRIGGLEKKKKTLASAVPDRKRGKRLNLEE